MQDLTIMSHHQQCLGRNSLLTTLCFLPHCWSCDDTNEQDSTPAERVARGEDKDVLEEECVQLR